MAHERVYGNLYLTEKIGQDEFSDEDEELIVLLARQAAIAVENAKLYETSQRRAREWEALFRLGEEIATSLDPMAILQVVTDRARALVNSDTALLALLGADGQYLHFVATSGVQTEALRKLAIRLDQGLAGAVFAAGSPLIVEDYASDPRLLSPPFAEVLGEGIVSTLAVPFAARGKPLGVLFISNRHKTSFTTGETDLLMALANLAAIAVENSRLFERLAAERERLQTIVDVLPEAVLVFSAPAGQIELANRSVERLSGRPVEQGTSMWQHAEQIGLSRPDGRSLREEELPGIRSLREGEVCEGEEFLLVRPDDSHVPILASSAPIINAEGKTEGVVVTWQDIRHLKEIDELKSNIISLVSHELRTPLAHIKGYASSLLQPDVEWDAETQRDFIASIDRQADRLARLINDLLDLSRIESGGAQPEPTSQEVIALVQGGLRLAQPLLRDREVRSEIEPGLPPVAADAPQIERVIANLLENAAKYSPPETPIEVRAELRDSEVVLSVIDQGVGLSSEEQAHVFEKFYRSRRASEQSPGTGLGLPICKGIVEAHGGRIWVKSPPRSPSRGRGAGTPGQGSAFHFTLPAFEGRV